jgi:2-amino-4-hydroxy-6-hydroxymethyldihydropteridine diphosphokinase
MRERVLACIGLGANLGDAAEQVRDAAHALSKAEGCEDLQLSPLYRTAPHEASGPDYVNAVATLQTRLTAPELLRLLQRLEAEAGRERPYWNAPRTLDLDLLFYGEARMDSPDLQLPHPRWASRAFVLFPLRDLCPHRVTEAMLASVSGQAIRQL